MISYLILLDDAKIKLVKMSFSKVNYLKEIYLTSISIDKLPTVNYDVLR